MPLIKQRSQKEIHIKALSEKNTSSRASLRGSCPQTLPRFQEGLPKLLGPTQVAGISLWSKAAIPGRVCNQK